MDLHLVRKGLLDYTRKKKRWVLLLVALGFSSYGAYKVCNLPSIVSKRRRISKLLGALVSMAEVISDSAETIGIMSNDFKDFLQSESDQIPNSLKQISKIARSDEFSESVVTLTRALTVGILRGYQSNSSVDCDVSANASCPCFLDMVFDKLSTPAGTGFVSAVVGSFARNMVMGFYQDTGTNSNSSSNDAPTNAHGGSEGDSVSRLVDAVCGEKCKALVGDCIQLFVSTAVAVYLDKTMDINTYDEIFAGMTNPKHEKKVSDVLVSVCNGAIETLVKTSHKVLTSDDSNASSSIDAPLMAIDHKGAEGNELAVPEPKGTESLDEVKDSAWVSKVSSTLAVPSNRRLILDVTARITFETVRSFLEFMLEKLYQGIKKCVDVIHEAVVDCTLGVATYLTAKSSVVATVCFSLCLRVLDGAWVFVPAQAMSISA